MKKSLLALSTILLGAFYSCSSDDSGTSGGSGNLSSLEPVSFDNVAEKEISATATGITLNGKKEYLVNRQRVASFDKAGQMNGATVDMTMLYPGSILQGESFMNGMYDPLVLSNPFKPVTLFITCNGSYSANQPNVEPKGSAILTAKSEMVDDYYNRPGIFGATPAYFTYSSEEVSNEESFKKSSSIHVNANFKAIVSASFGYDKNTAWTNNKHYVVCKLSQIVYSAAIDPKYTTDWIDGEIKGSECGKNEPLYISNVDYGRVAYLLIEDSRSTSEITTLVQASVKVGLPLIGGSANYSTSTELKKLFDSKKVTVAILGGSSQTLVTDYKTFLDYLNPKNTDLVGYSAPIAYTVRRLKDNTTVNIRVPYLDIYKEFR